MTLAEAHAALDSLILTSRKDRGEAVLERIAEAMEYICAIEREIEPPAREPKAEAVCVRTIPVDPPAPEPERTRRLALEKFGIDFRYTYMPATEQYFATDLTTRQPLGFFASVDAIKEAVNWPEWTANGWERKA